MHVPDAMQPAPRPDKAVGMPAEPGIHHARRRPA